MAGRFIVFEGLDGSGISTQIRRLALSLDAREIRYYTTKEPTDGPLGSLIRQALRGRLRVDEKTLALMFAADRSDHVHQTVLPRTVREMHVLSERYILSSLAYQPVQLGNKIEWILDINRENIADLMPDLIIYLDVPPAVALSRIDSGRYAVPRERFEEQGTLASTERAFKSAICLMRERFKTQVAIIK